MAQSRIQSKFSFSPYYQATQQTDGCSLNSSRQPIVSSEVSPFFRNASRSICTNISSCVAICSIKLKPFCLELLHVLHFKVPDTSIHWQCRRSRASEMNWARRKVVIDEPQECQIVKGALHNLQLSSHDSGYNNFDHSSSRFLEIVAVESGETRR
jgi:hypothetical protein